jgi:type IV secretion system protein VirD4
MNDAARSTGFHPFELAAGVVAAALVALVALVWLAGCAAVLAFEARWPHLGLADALTAVAHLPRHLADPRAAWPTRARRQLPGAPAMYAAAAAVGSAVGIATWKLGLRAAWQRGSAPSARWAGNHDLRRLLSRRPLPGRVTLGRRGRKLVCCERLHSALVIGPTQSGKTTGLAIPAILEWDGPVLATSVKTDLLRDTFDARQERGPVALFDPAECTGYPCDSWTPLAACSSWAGARRIASWLAEGATTSKRGLADGDFWYSAAAKLLAPLLFAAASAGRSMADVVRWIDTMETFEVEYALKETRQREAIDAFTAATERELRQRSSVYTTAETILEAYSDPGVLNHSRTCTIVPEDLFDGRRRTLYLSATVREQRRLRPVFVALIESVLEEAYRRSARAGGPLDPPLLVVLDEAANIAPLPDLDVLASTAAGHGVQLLTVLQDLAQAHDRWGRERADTIVNNHRARVIAGGAADGRTLEYVGRLLGDAEIEQRSRTSGEPGRHTVTVSSTYRPLAPANVVREAPEGTALLLYGSLPPAWLRFRPWFKEPVRRSGRGSGRP